MASSPLLEPAGDIAGLIMTSFEIPAPAKNERELTSKKGHTLSLGECREGGTSKIPDVVVVQNTSGIRTFSWSISTIAADTQRRNCECLTKKWFCLILNISRTRSDSDVEVEDFLSVSCVDRFYEAYPDLRPEKEIIDIRNPFHVAWS